MDPIVGAIEACKDATEVSAAVNRFFAWMRRTRPDFNVLASLNVSSARDIVGCLAAVRAAAKQRKGRTTQVLDDLLYVEQVLHAAWRKLERLAQS
jgi:hypothetical protein